MLQFTEYRKKVDWIINQHKNTNHMYDTYLPYEFHLKMVVNVYEDFKHLLPEKMYIEVDSRDEEIDVTQKVIYLSCWGHDLIEDTRTSYNDVKKNLDVPGYVNGPIASIIYAVTNEKGKNREERANDKYYEGIRNTLGADFVKLCDRIANTQYSKMTKSDMFEKYRKENDNFMVKIGYDDTNTHPYFDMFIYLTDLFYE
jgi:hypothetical protein